MPEATVLWLFYRSLITLNIMLMFFYSLLIIYEEVSEALEL